MLNENRPRVLAIDLDGTLLQDVPFPELGDPIPGIQEEIDLLKRMGWYIVVWTCRGEEYYEAIQQHLTAHGICVDNINANPWEITTTSPKIYGDVYVDDRALPFDGEAKGLAARVLSHRPWHKRNPLGDE